MTPRLKLVCAGAALLSLGACGLTGDLERPDPIFGEKPAETAREVPSTPTKPTTPAPTRTPMDPVPDLGPSGDDELLGGPGGF